MRNGLLPLLPAHILGQLPCGRGQNFTSFARLLDNSHLLSGKGRRKLARPRGAPFYVFFFFSPVVSLQLKLGFVCWVVCWSFFLFFFSFGAVVHLSNYEIKLFQAFTSRNATFIHAVKFWVLRKMRKAEKPGLEVTAQPHLSNGLPHSDVQGSGNIPGTCETSTGDREGLFCSEKITS